MNMPGLRGWVWSCEGSPASCGWWAAAWGSWSPGCPRSPAPNLNKRGWGVSQDMKNLFPRENVRPWHKEAFWLRTAFALFRSWTLRGWGVSPDRNNFSPRENVGPWHQEALSQDHYQTLQSLNTDVFLISVQILIRTKDSMNSQLLSGSWGPVIGGPG